jgi:hypothetical protein
MLHRINGTCHSEEEDGADKVTNQNLEGL